MIQSVDELLGQLRGVTGPEPAPPPQPFPWLEWLVAIGGLAVGTWIWWWLRRPKPQLPADVEALQALGRLPDSPTEPALTYCERLVRRYLERQHQIPARMLTPAECNDEISDAWREVLTLLQVRRFAPAQSAPDSWSGLVRQLESLIRDDRIKAAGEASCVKSRSDGNRL